MEEGCKNPSNPPPTCGATCLPAKLPKVSVWNCIQYAKLFALGVQTGDRGISARQRFNNLSFLNYMNREHMERHSFPQHDRDRPDGVKVPGLTYIDPEVTKTGTARASVSTTVGLITVFSLFAF